jgi:hypothetical protein
MNKNDVDNKYYKYFDGTPNNINQLKLLYENSITLSKLNFNVSV